MSSFPVSASGSVSAKAYFFLDYIKTQNPSKEQLFPFGLHEMTHPEYSLSFQR